MAPGDGSRRDAEVLTLSLTGLDAHVVRVVAEVGPGPTAFEFVGIAAGRVRETRVRVRAALQAIGTDLPAETITIRFDRSEFITTGSADAAIAIAILAALGQIDAKLLKGTAIVGELSLTGAFRSVRGVLPMLRGTASRGLSRILVPKVNGNEAAHATRIRVELVDHLHELVRHFREGVPLQSAGAPPPFPVMPLPGSPDLSDIHGMHAARRALEIAAAGGHPLLFVGPPGAGMTALTRRLPGILPLPTPEEALDITSIHSVAGLLPPDRGFLCTRPFRAPHHTVSAAGLLGGGDPVRPGEVTLAHHGVLYLDAISEFKGSTLESLALVLRDGQATILRRGVRTCFPAEALLVCATNPCPCGYALTAPGRCTCSPKRVATYRTHLRRPPFDRTDVRIILPAVDVAELQKAERGEPSEVVRVRVTAARAAQSERARTLGSVRTNAALMPSDLDRLTTPDAAGARVLAEATERLSLSAAAHGRVLRVARTIADLEGSNAVRAPHITEALTMTIEAADLPSPSPSAAGGDHAA
jgi:magnesium chelatase family protein